MSIIIFIIIISSNEKTFFGISDIAPSSEKLFKVLLIGDPGVGKTSFVQRYTNDAFKDDYKGTVGVDFALKVSATFFKFCCAACFG